jgi:hypothetical protein
MLALLPALLTAKLAAIVAVFLGAWLRSWGQCVAAFHPCYSHVWLCTEHQGRQQTGQHSPLLGVWHSLMGVWATSRGKTMLRLEIIIYVNYVSTKHMLQLYVQLGGL